MSKQNFTIDESSVITSLSRFADTYREGRTLNQPVCINGEVVEQLLNLYRALCEVHDSFDTSDITEMLLENYSESFHYTVSICQPTDKLLNDKIGGLYYLQIILNAFYKSEQAIKAFETLIVKQ